MTDRELGSVDALVGRLLNPDLVKQDRDYDDAIAFVLLLLIDIRKHVESTAINTKKVSYRTLPSPYDASIDRRKPAKY